MPESVSPVPLVRNCPLGGQQACLAIEAPLGGFVGVKGKHPIVTAKCTGCNIKLEGHVIDGAPFVVNADKTCPRLGASKKNLN